jgi:hypothetical protein
VHQTAYSVQSGPAGAVELLAGRSGSPARRRPLKTLLRIGFRGPR